MHKLGIAQEIIDLTTEYVRGARVKRVWRRPRRTRASGRCGAWA